MFWRRKKGKEEEKNGHPPVDPKAETKKLDAVDEDTAIIELGAKESREELAQAQADLEARNARVQKLAEDCKKKIETTKLKR